MKTKTLDSYWMMDISSDLKSSSKLLIFKTDIESKKNVEQVRPVFNSHPIITDWFVDIDDVDNVLRIEASQKLQESEVIKLIRNCGFHCEVLED